MNRPFISIIIPARNARATIRKCLDSIFNLNYRNYEVIVVDDGSDDGTDKILASYPKVKILTTLGCGPSKARNAAIEQAKGNLIAFTDADCLVDPEWLLELLRGFTDEKIAGVGGAQKSPEDDSWFGSKVNEFLTIFGFISGYMKSGLKIKQTAHNPSCNVVYRKSILTETGGFLAGLWPGEDVELDYRIRKRGQSLIFNPRAVVYHYRPSNLKDFTRMMFRYGRAQGWLVKKYGIFRLIQLIPILTNGLVILFIIVLSCNWKIAFLLFLLALSGLYLISSNYVSFFLAIAGLGSWHLGYIKGLFK